MAMASIDAVSTDKLKVLLECSVCLETVTEPRTLPCFHSYCKICLERFVQNQRDKGVELNCANCRTNFTLNEEGVEGMKQNHFVLSMLDLMKIQNQIQCIPCGHNCQEPSVGRCVTCEKFMCKECLESHDKYKGFCDHLVLSMGDLSKPENKGKIKETALCKKHKGEKLKLYCETCEKTICRDCMDFGDHPRPEHKCLLLEAVAEERMVSLKTDSETLDQMLSDGKETLQNLTKCLQSLEDDIKAKEQEINDTKENILKEIEQILSEKAEAMINDEREKFDARKKEIHEDIDQTKSYVSKVSGTADMSKNVLDNGKEEEIVSSEKNIKKNLKKLKNEKQGKTNCWKEAEFYDPDTIRNNLIEEVVTKVVSKKVDYCEKPSLLSDKAVEVREYWQTTVDYSNNWKEGKKSHEYLYEDAETDTSQGYSYKGEEVGCCYEEMPETKIDCCDEKMAEIAEVPRRRDDEVKGLKSDGYGQCVYEEKKLNSGEYQYSKNTAKAYCYGVEKKVDYCREDIPREAEVQRHKDDKVKVVKSEGYGKCDYKEKEKTSSGYLHSKNTEKAYGYVENKGVYYYRENIPQQAEVPRHKVSRYKEKGKRAKK